MNHIVTIERGETGLVVHTPYHERFVREAKALPKKLRGKWDPDAKAWAFPPEAEEEVRALCREVYGDDGTTADLVTLRIEWKKAARSWNAPFYLNGRRIAYAFGRKTGAKLGDGVTVLTGGFDSGGTFRDWETTVQAGTVVLFANLPRAEAQALVDKQSRGANCRYRIEPTESDEAPAKRTRTHGARQCPQWRIGSLDDASTRKLHTNAIHKERQP